LDGAGNPIEVPYVTMTWYAVMIGDDFFDIREPIDAQPLYESNGTFCFEIETDDWPRGTTTSVWARRSRISCSSVSR
jgi:hypothetical protein